MVTLSQGCALQRGTASSSAVLPELCDLPCSPACTAGTAPAPASPLPITICVWETAAVPERGGYEAGEGKETGKMCPGFPARTDPKQTPGLSW